MGVPRLSRLRMGLPPARPMQLGEHGCTYLGAVRPCGVLSDGGEGVEGSSASCICSLGFRVNSNSKPHAENLATIVICTQDRAPFLKRCLAGLSLSYRETGFPVLVIDNGSSDSTALLLEAKAKSGKLDFESVPQPGLSAARNTALNRTVTPYIGYLDDDAVPDINWARAV
jgi:hypothetical protein